MRAHSSTQSFRSQAEYVASSDTCQRPLVCHDLGVTITVTIRPEGTRRPGTVEVTGLPWDERPGSGYETIEDAMGGPGQGAVLYENGSFSVGRLHAQRLVLGLAERFGRVHVVQFGGSAACGQDCWASDEGDPFACDCSCAGANHGGGDETLVGPPSAAPKDRRSRPRPRRYDVRRSGDATWPGGVDR